jgi:hypothetical protein
LKTHAVSRYGHLGVGLSKDGKVRYLLVHRLVLEAFVGSCPKGCQARHVRENDTSNNSLSNLKWGTPKQDRKDMIRHGNSTRGEKNASAVLKREDVVYIKKRLKYKYRGLAVELAKQFGVSDSLIRSIGNGHRWNHVNL